MTETIRWGNRLLDIPQGFRKLPWSCATENLEVYIVGAKEGKPWAYGPHWVVNGERKVLRNAKGEKFVENTDGVLLKQVIL